MQKLYGEDQDGRAPIGFHMIFDLYTRIAMRVEQCGNQEVCDSLMDELLAMIDDQIARFQELEVILAVEDRQRLKYRASAAMVPGPEVSDRLMRYGAHLSREIERNLNLLERLQRIRKGQPVTPQVDVNISA
jgi:hypothetical protein